MDIFTHVTHVYQAAEALVLAKDIRHGGVLRGVVHVGRRATEFSGHLIGVEESERAQIAVFDGTALRFDGQSARVGIARVPAVGKDHLQAARPCP